MLLLALAIALSPGEGAPERLAQAFSARLLELTHGEGAAVEAGDADFTRRVEAELARRGAHPSSLRARGVLTERGDRLLASFRLEAPDGALVGIVCASSTKDPPVASTPQALVATRGVIRVLGASWSSLEDEILALAALGTDRVAALSADAVLLLRLGSPATLEVREALPPPFQTVRGRAGILEVADKDSLWVLSDRTGRADLLSVGAHRVSWGPPARIPPGFPPSLGFRPGTSLLEGVADGPFLAWLPGAPAFGVDLLGNLLALGPGAVRRADLRVGPPLARLGDLLVASSASPPGGTDHLLFVDQGELAPVDTLELPGAIRAIATREGVGEVDVALATPTGTQLLSLRVAR
jgi:hypothetical protein